MEVFSLIVDLSCPYPALSVYSASARNPKRFFLPDHRGMQRGIAQKMRSAAYRKSGVDNHAHSSLRSCYNVCVPKPAPWQNFGVHICIRCSVMKCALKITPIIENNE